MSAQRPCRHPFPLLVDEHRVAHCAGCGERFTISADDQSITGPFIPEPPETPSWDPEHSREIL